MKLVLWVGIRKEIVVSHEGNDGNFIFMFVRFDGVCALLSSRFFLCEVLMS